MEKRIVEYITNLIDGVNVEVTNSQIIIEKTPEVEIIFEVEGLSFDEMTKKIEDWYLLHSKISEYINKVDKDMSCWTNNDTVIIYHPDWDEITFPLDETIYSYEDVYEEIKEYFSLKYVPVKACYSDNYIEVLIKLSEVIWGDGLSDVTFLLDSDQDGSHKIHYEISAVSEHFATTIQKNQGYSDIIVNENFTTLKIYNVNDVESISIDDEKYESTIWYIANCILFEISSKYGVAIELLELPEEEDEGYIETDLDVLNSIEKPFLKKKYDIDLINYYHRALNMTDSEFKYLAFYQILECIFDEVYQYETVQDVKQIMNSSWFSSYNDNDIMKIIEEVDRYNKGKNDREKLKLVLEKYFKGEVHEPAYLVANKEISKIIIEDLSAMKTEKEMNDLQKLSGILYDFRCECTHSNRSYPFRTQFKKTEGELEKYISLVQKVAERVITNYPSK